MRSPSPDQPIPPSVNTHAATRLRIVALVLAPPVFTGTVVAGLVLRRMYSAAVVIPRAALALVLMAGTLMFLGCVVRHLHGWRRPLRWLERTLEQVRAGEATIDQLRHITGPLAPLREQIRDLLRQIRIQKAELVRVNDEMRQRIAQRTSALERLTASLRAQANHDALTGLYNRRMFDQHVQSVLDQARSDGTDLCFLVLDLDNFKSLNDTLGHHAGDQFLRGVGQIIRSTIRENDLAFRYGGDEFAVVLADCAPEAGQALAARLTSLVDGLGSTIKLPRPLGISVGAVALSEMTGAELPQLLAEADNRLYAFKETRKRRAASRTAIAPRPSSRSITVESHHP